MNIDTGSISASDRTNVMFARSFAVLFAISCFLFLASESTAQRPQFGVTVQLPTIRTFSIQTAVSVPDGGTVSLGGVSRSSEGRVSSGVPGLPGRPFRNSAIGRSTGSSRATVTTKIISQRELEEDLLAQSSGTARSSSSSSARLTRSNRTQQALDYLNGKTDTNPYAPRTQQQSSGADMDASANEGRQVASIEEVEAFADFLAANIGRRRR
ncbi:MAG: hypothetical protein AAFN77_01165 [Planctomycetota bacterium]